MQTVETDWTRTDSRLPKDGELVQTMDSGGHVQPLRRRGRLWFFADNSMYVYYTPTMWKPMERGGRYAP
jgi:hypothetical protein